ncbi:MAG TPA: SET domain-containing protein-lysine N-methyltransferase [Streptomyces sp.]|uniref:SET domain-containing protein-lysine N-methyltransferase n=1 Tax=Streptomyces sp. TaxID=1931 RepID=UPI002BFEF12B|nr:SET domain-containing protein-lysine N-methyltransferase [Streptomyces sp.]HWU08611.1 SET domain-containing protein-lysine N-methyltransferase [Streptomyces sp.]
MDICVLYSLDVGETDERRAVDLAPLLPEHQVRHLGLDKLTGIRTLQRTRADLYINLCDGAWGEARAGIEIVQELERRGAPFTGPRSTFYDPTRHAMKLAAEDAGLSQPGYRFVRDRQDAAEALEELRLPCIVKPDHGADSIGITPASRVTTPGRLLHQADLVVEEFGGALIEEFIDGREMTVLVASDPTAPGGDRAYPTAEYPLIGPQDFQTHQHKWGPGEHPPPHACPDPALDTRLRELSLRLYRTLGGSGYARIDWRIDAGGTPYFLEINPACSVFYPCSADTILEIDGSGRAGFLRALISDALERHRRTQAPYEVRRHPEKGRGLYATRPLAVGETVYSDEETALVVASRGHIQRTWDPYWQRMFRDFAYPLGPDVYALWDPDPLKWRPLNHSCDPNTWLDGLTLIARRPIAEDEEITFDYATVYTEGHLNAERCLCATDSCRGGWRGEDHLQPWFPQRYGTHVSSHVRQSQEVRRPLPLAAEQPL